MSDGSADRPHVVSPVPPIQRDERATKRGLVVPLRVAFDHDLSDRRLIKVVLMTAAILLFGLAVMGWL